MNVKDFRECCSCARLIEPRDREDCRCRGCGSFVCKLCVHVVIWEHDAEVPSGKHRRKDHVDQAIALGISVDARTAASLAVPRALRCPPDRVRMPRSSKEVPRG